MCIADHRLKFRCPKAVAGATDYSFDIPIRLTFVERGGMAQNVCVIASADDRARLAAIVADRSWPLRHVQRARIVLHSADRLQVSRPAGWRWQRHYAEGGVERLLHEGSRKPDK